MLGGGRRPDASNQAERCQRKPVSHGLSLAVAERAANVVDSRDRALSPLARQRFLAPREEVFLRRVDLAFDFLAFLALERFSS